MEIAKIAWLAGLIDGEGCIAMYQVRTKDRKRGIAEIFQLEVCNDDTTIINEAKDILTELTGQNVNVGITKDCRPHRKGHIHYRVMVVHHRGIVKALSILEPYLVGKKAQAQILLKLLRTHQRGQPYTKLELEVIDILKQMKMQNRHLAEGNTEPSRSDKPLQACVETLQAQLL